MNVSPKIVISGVPKELEKNTMVGREDNAPRHVKKARVWWGEKELRGENPELDSPRKTN